MVVTPHAVDLVVAGHDGERLSFLDRDFKSFQVDFAQRTLADLRIVAVAEALLVVAGKVLDAGRPAGGLHAAHHGRRHFARQIRIFGEILEVAAAERVAVNIHARPQQHMRIKVLHLLRNQRIELLHAFGIESAGQRGTAGQQRHRLADADA